MSSVKFNPFNPNKKALHNLVDDFFNLSISDFIGSDFVASQPSVNIIEAKENFRLEVAAPGLSKEDFALEIEKDQLKISVRKEAVEANEEEKYTRREFGYRDFTRSFQLPETVDVQNIDAAYKDGILTITLHKKAEAKEMPARKIEIS